MSTSFIACALINLLTPKVTVSKCISVFVPTCRFSEFVRALQNIRHIICLANGSKPQFVFLLRYVSFPLQVELFVRYPLGGSVYDCFKNTNRGLGEEYRMRKRKAPSEESSAPPAQRPELPDTYEALGMCFISR